MMRSIAGVWSQLLREKRFTWPWSSLRVLWPYVPEWSRIPISYQFDHGYLWRMLRAPGTD